MPDASHLPEEPPLGVGFVGAGPVTQAIHLPALARLTGLFRVAHVMDADADVAGSVAARVGARATASLDEMLADPAVEVVAVCSPHAFHAEQVVAACRAGKRAVLCEKPFATSPDDAALIAEASAETGVPIVVGAMHAYDEGWLVARRTGFVPTRIRSSIVLPPNARFEDFATEVIARPDPPSVDPDDPSSVAAMVEGGVIGLAIHDLPLVRSLLRRAGEDAWCDPEVVWAELLAPFGYLVVLRSGGIDIELHAAMNEGWQPEWHLQAWGEDAGFDVEFTPSYVHAGSGTATVLGDGVAVTPPADGNGYEGEWRELARVARGGAPTIPLDDLVDDLVFALRIAGRASEAARAHVEARSTARGAVS